MSNESGNAERSAAEAPPPGAGRQSSGEANRGARPRRGRQVALWTAVLLAAVAGWFAVRLQHTAPRRAAVAAIKERGGSVWYEEQFSDGAWNEAPEPSGWRLWLGNSQVVRVFLKTRVGDRELGDLKPHLQNLPELRDLVLMGCPVTDNGLAQLHDVAQVRRLVLINTQVTAAGVSQLRRANPRCIVTREDASH